MRHFSNCLIFLALASLSGALAAERETLPSTVVPVHYDLALVPNAEALTFSGQVTITVKPASTRP